MHAAAGWRRVPGDLFGPGGPATLKGLGNSVRKMKMHSHIEPKGRARAQLPLKSARPRPSSAGPMQQPQAYMQLHHLKLRLTSQLASSTAAATEAFRSEIHTSRSPCMQIEIPCRRQSTGSGSLTHCTAATANAVTTEDLDLRLHFTRTVQYLLWRRCVRACLAVTSLIAFHRIGTRMSRIIMLHWPACQCMMPCMSALRLLITSAHNPDNQCCSV